MIWLALLPAIATYLLVARLVRDFGLSLVGNSPAGRSAAPVVAALWLPAMCLIIACALVTLVEAGFDHATGWVRNPENLR